MMKNLLKMISIFSSCLCNRLHQPWLFYIMFQGHPSMFSDSSAIFCTGFSCLEARFNAVIPLQKEDFVSNRIL